MHQTKIKHIEAGEILDSRGNPTVMATVVLEGGAKAAACSPSGASTGKKEAYELRDGNKERYNGLGVIKACSNVNVKISKVLLGMDALDQREIDNTMIDLDGTKNKFSLGANAILSVSLACARAAAVARSIPLYESIKQAFGFKHGAKMPVPIMNIINGGKHASTNIKLQEFQIIPVLGRTVSKKIETGSEIFHALGNILKEKGLDKDIGDEGGYAPDVEDIAEVFQMIKNAIKKAGFVSGKDVFLGIDSAASSFYDAIKKNYVIGPPNKVLSAIELSRTYEDWADKYGVKSFEDPFEEESWGDWIRFTARNIKTNIIIIGDDLLVTDKNLLKQAIDKKAVNAILIKVNQIGTLSEAIDAIKLAQENDIKVIISHRSGETNDAFISDLAVAVGADYIKAGAPSRGERVAKYNRLMEIEHIVNNQ